MYLIGVLIYKRVKFSDCKIFAGRVYFYRNK